MVVIVATSVKERPKDHAPHFEATSVYHAIM